MKESRLLPIHIIKKQRVLLNSIINNNYLSSMDTGNYYYYCRAVAEYLYYNTVLGSVHIILIID